MAILREVAVSEPVVARNNRPFAGFATERPRAKIWANIGYMKGERFINLPLGSPIDTMEPSNVRGQNEDWVTLQNDRNEFLADLQTIGADMKPGEERELFNVIVKLRRVNDDLVVEQSGEKLPQADRIAMFTGAKKAPVETPAGSPASMTAPSKEELQAQLEALQKALAVA
jgi:hypothetical protein